MSKCFIFLCAFVTYIKTLCYVMLCYNACNMIDWKPVIGIAAVSCSDFANGELCRKLTGSAYPSLKVQNVL